MGNGLFEGLDGTLPRSTSEENTSPKNTPKNGTGIFRGIDTQPQESPESKNVAMYQRKFDELEGLSAETKKLLGDDLEKRLDDIKTNISKIKDGIGYAPIIFKSISEAFSKIDKNFDDAVLKLTQEPKKEESSSILESITKVIPGMGSSDRSQTEKKKDTKKDGNNEVSIGEKWKDSGSFYPKEKNSNNSDEKGDSGKKSSESGADPKLVSEKKQDTLSDSSNTFPLLKKLNLYIEYLEYKKNSKQSKSVQELIDFIKLIKSNISHINAIGESVNEVNSIIKDFAENNGKFRGVSSSTKAAFEKTIKESQKARGGIQDSLLDNSVEGNTLWIFPDTPPRQAIRKKIEKVKTLNFETIIKQISSGELDLQYVPVDSGDLENELEQFISHSDDPDFIKFLTENKHEIIKELQEAEKIHTELQKELDFYIEFIKENKDDLDKKTLESIQNDVKGIIAYMLFINALHDPAILLPLLQAYKDISIPGVIYSLANLFIDEWASYATAGIVGGIIVKRHFTERKNKSGFVQAISENASFKNRIKEFLSGGLFTDLEKMKIEEIYNLFELDENGKNALRLKYPEQYENIKKLRDIVAIMERMGADGKTIIQLQNLKNSAVWGTSNTFSREVFKIGYGLKQGKANIFKRTILKILDLGVIESTMDIYGLQVSGSPRVPGENKISQRINSLVGILFPRGHGIDNYGKSKAPDILELFIKQNIELTKESTKFEKWLINQVHSSNPDLKGIDENTVKFTLQEIVSQSMDESYSQAKNIVDNILVNGKALGIDQLKTREELIKKIEDILDNHRWFGKTRIAAIIKEINFFKQGYGQIRAGINEKFGQSINPSREITLELGAELNPKNIQLLLNEGSLMFRSISDYFKKEADGEISTGKIREHLVGVLNDRLKTEIKLGNVFPKTGSVISTEEEKTIAKNRRAGIKGKLEKLEKYFPNKTAPDMSSVSDEDLEDVDKMADRMKEIKKHEQKSRIGDRLETKVEEVLKGVCKDISNGKYGYNTILDELVVEIPQVHDIIESYANLDTKIKDDIMNHLERGIGEKEAGGTIKRIHDFRELFAKVGGDPEMEKFLGKAFVSNDDVDGSRLQALKTHYEKVSRLAYIPPTKIFEGTVEKLVTHEQTIEQQEEKLRNKLLARDRGTTHSSSTSDVQHSTATVSDGPIPDIAEPSASEVPVTEAIDTKPAIPVTIDIPERTPTDPELTPEQIENRGKIYDLIDRMEVEVALQNSGRSFSGDEHRKKVMDSLEKGKSIEQISKEVIYDINVENNTYIKDVRGWDELSLEIAKKVDNTPLGDLTELQKSILANRGVGIDEKKSFIEEVIKRFNKGKIRHL